MQASFRAKKDFTFGPTSTLGQSTWSPVTTTYYSWLAPTYGITLTTCPAATIPCGLDEKGMPFGLQIVGAAKDDAFVLGAAHALEQAFARTTDLRRPAPDIAKLASGPTPSLRSIIEV